MEQINRSHLVLLPKCQGAIQVGDFQPISLSNAVYLILAKILANKLWEEISDLVRPCQSAFIPGQQLVGGTVVVGEILSLWQRKGTKYFI